MLEVYRIVQSLVTKAFAKCIQSLEIVISVRDVWTEFDTGSYLTTFFFTGTYFNNCWCFGTLIASWSRLKLSDSFMYGSESVFHFAITNQFSSCLSANTILIKLLTFRVVYLTWSSELQADPFLIPFPSFFHFPLEEMAVKGVAVSGNRISQDNLNPGRHSNTH